MENNINNNHPEEEVIDIKKLLLIVLANIHWFIISVVIAIGIGHFIKRYTTKIYKVSTTVLIEDNTKGSSMLSRNVGGSLDMFSGFGMYPSLKNFTNQSLILKSYSQIRHTLDQLDFEVSYYNQGRISTIEIYKDAPFKVIYNKNHVQPLGINFNLSIEPNGQIKLIVEESELSLHNYKTETQEGKKSIDSIEKTLKPGERWITDNWDFQIKIEENFNPEGKNNYIFRFNTLDQLTNRFRNRVLIEPMEKGSSMISISLDINNPQKGVDFLNMLAQEYLKRGLNKKNEIATKTIEFIDSQLDTIKYSLNIVEENLENFRTNNNVLDLSFQSEKLFEQVQELENQHMQFDMQLNYYNYLADYVSQSQDLESVLAPSAMGVQDPLLNQLIMELNQLSIQRSSMINVKKNTDFYMVKQLDAQIENAKRNLTENTSSLIERTKINIKDINNRLNELVKQVNKLPDTERKLFGIERQFKLNDNIYTYLLQKKSEALIARASNTTDNEIIDTAMVKGGGSPIKPKGKKIYMIALFIGLIIPAIYLLLKDFFNNKIDSPEMVEKITKRPIVGLIPNSGDINVTNVLDNPDSPWAEAFRFVRTKMQFITKQIKSPIITITSSIPGEGKSFIAINIASIYSITGKKTVLVGMDLRRPQLAQRFGLDKNKGVTNYLIGDMKYEEIIQKTNNNSLDIVASGIIPPNPSELVEDDKTATLIKKLQEDYDIVILDTAPLSPVSDTYHLAKLADANIFVVRDRYTHKYAFEASISEAENSQLPNLCVVINDVAVKKRGYSYKYGYKYGYSHGYSHGYGYSKKQKTK